MYLYLQKFNPINTKPILNVLNNINAIDDVFILFVTVNMLYNGSTGNANIKFKHDTNVNKYRIYESCVGVHKL